MALKSTFDVIVVGSGPSGAMAAQTLVESGANVGMLDGGYVDREYAGAIPASDFISIRESELNQNEYFLGKRFEGISFGGIKSGAQLTPPRQFVTAGVEKLLPAEGELEIVESLAYGGLGGAWGLGCFTYSETEMREVGLQSDLLPDAYRLIARRVGISGAYDDSSPYAIAPIDNLQPPTKLGTAMNKIYSRYEKKREKLKKLGVTLGQTPLALLTEQIGNREPVKYLDMDFWTNHGDSAYRPAITISQLRQKTNFTYIGRELVMTFVETGGGVEITTLNIDTGSSEKFFSKKLVLAAGALGTARIIMRSYGRFGERFPIVSGLYSYFPCIQPEMLGKKIERHKISYSGLSLFHDPRGDKSAIRTTQLYTYSSLMAFRLAGSLPFDFADTIRLLKFGVPSLVIAGVHHPDYPTPEKFLILAEDQTSPTGDKLLTYCKLTDKEKLTQREHELAIAKALRSLGCYPLKRIAQGYGSSIHYGGTVPFDKSGRPFTLSPLGKLSDTRHIFVADGSGWNMMPGKGPTLTFMANAHVVAANINND